MLFSAFITLGLTALAAAVPAPVEKRALANVVYSCTVPNTAALTFDDGPWVYLYDISKTLKAAGAVGTFFFNGNNYGCIYDADQQKRVKYAYSKGHQVASHTWSHKNLATLSWDEIHDEMWRVEQALQRIVGVTPAFMRPPYGSFNDRVREASAVRGQTLAIWDFDSGDSNGSSVDQQKSSYTQLAQRRPNTVLTLNHETHESTAHNLLPHAIQKLQAAGYKLVTLAECLGQEPYQSVGQPQTGSWTC